MGRGRSKAGGTTSSAKPLSVSETKSFAELETYMKDRYNITVTDNVKNLNFNAVKEGLQGVEQMMNDYPELKDTLKTVQTSKTGVMSCGGETINFNPFYFTGADADTRLKEMAVRNSDARWWTPNASVKSAAIHETAHALVYQMTTKHISKVYTGFSPDMQKRMTIMAWNDGTVAKQIVGTANKRAKKSEYGKGKTVKALAESTSRYAGSYSNAGARAHEIIAESFADVMTNGGKASPYSREVFKAANEYYKSL